MTKLIIEYEGDRIDINEVLSKVGRVIAEGRISEHTNGAHFCWVTEFKDGVRVITRIKQTKDSADSLIVRMGNQSND